MKLSLFRTGWIPRIGAALVYAALAFGSVIVVTKPTSPSTTEASEPADSGREPSTEVLAHLSVDSVQPVSKWIVRNRGARIEPSFSDAHTWEAEFSPDAMALSIVTTSESPAGANALRVRLRLDDRHREFTYWCPGDCAIDVGPEAFALPEATNGRP